MADLHGVKVGDKLYITKGCYGGGFIEAIDRITPSGRVVTRTGTFDQSGYLRGETSSWYRTKARVATEDDAAGIYRIGLVDKFKSFDWNKCSAEDLKSIAVFVNKYSGSKP